MPQTPPSTVFLPPRRPGLVLLGSAMLVLAGGSALAFYITFQVGETRTFLASLTLGVVLFAPLLLLGYQAYALSNASYSLERDGLLIRWGLRLEDIPLPEIEWVRPAADFAGRLPMPWPRWQGAILGVRHSEALGTVEYLAADPARMLLVATPKRLYAISPADPIAFLSAFRRANELGSLSPLRAQSANPILLVSSLWADSLGSILVLGGMAVGLALLAWVSLAIPTHATLALGFNPNGTPADPGPAARLLLLPVLNGVYFIVDLLGGLFFYRRATGVTAIERHFSLVEARAFRLLAYLLWASGLLSGVILLVGVYDILR